MPVETLDQYLFVSQLLQNQTSSDPPVSLPPPTLRLLVLTPFKRSSHRARLAASKQARYPINQATATGTSLSRHGKKSLGSGTARTIAQLRAELRQCGNRTRALESALQDILSRLKEAQVNLGTAKQHHREAMEQARESKKIICRYLELGMTIPPCKSLDLPMEVYSDDSNYKLAAMIKEQENHISRLRRSVGGIQDEISENQKEARRIKRCVSLRQAKRAAKGS